MQLRNCEKVDQKTRDPERELASRELPVKREFREHPRVAVEGFAVEKWGSREK